jgi:hypothetical protein
LTNQVSLATIRHPFQQPYPQCHEKRIISDMILLDQAIALGQMLEELLKGLKAFPVPEGQRRSNQCCGLGWSEDSKARLVHSTVQISGLALRTLPLADNPERRDPVATLGSTSSQPNLERAAIGLPHPLDD